MNDSTICDERIADVLNDTCSCSSLDIDKLNEGPLKAVHSPIPANQFFSETPSFINLSEVERMKDILHSIRSALQLPSIRNEFLKSYPREIARRNSEGGVFLSLDFHRTSDGPKLIEINTNAGGAFLQFKLMTAQIRCCKAVDLALPNLNELKGLKDTFFSIFIEEWSANGHSGLPKVVAIVDNNPQAQFLYSEFLLFRDLFQSKGIKCIILSPEQIERRNGNLYFEDQKIDLIYNRLTDFHLFSPECAHLHSAWSNGEVVLTPNPMDYDLFARKSNLVFLSDSTFLKSAGLDEHSLEILERSIPKTSFVNPDKSVEIWNKRKSIFFKPEEGFGSKAAYCGGKLTKGKYNEILNGDYIYQELIPPSVRTTSISGTKIGMKMDLRAYIYRNEILLFASRLYRGQTTNFSTKGGGFSPVYVMPDIVQVLN